MAKLSRTQRYQELRDQLDEQTTKAQSQPVKTPRLSRVNDNVSSNALPHSAKAYFPHEETQARPADANIAPSPVMDELLGEVKRYNIENGNRITADTQINILKSLDDPETETMRRKQHVLPMEEPEESFGSTMKMSAFASETKTEAPKPAPKKARIVLTANDIRADEFEETDELDVLMMGKSDDMDQTIRQETVKAEPKKKKKKKKKAEPAARKKPRPEPKAEPVLEEEMPSAKMRRESQPKKAQKAKPQKNTGNRFLNIALTILIILLLAAVGAMFFYIKKLGLF